MAVITVGHDGRKWLRSGECNRCGECCLGTDPSIKNPMFTDAERADRQFAQHCPLLRFADGRYGCAGHGAHPFHATGCDTHPREPADLELTPSCSYTFEAV